MLLSGILWWMIKFVLQVGFLYLRYAADPKTLWSWFEPYIQDDEVLHLSSSSCFNSPFPTSRFHLLYILWTTLLLRHFWLHAQVCSSWGKYILLLYYYFYVYSFIEHIFLISLCAESLKWFLSKILKVALTFIADFLIVSRSFTTQIWLDLIIST